MGLSSNLDDSFLINSFCSELLKLFNPIFGFKLFLLFFFLSFLFLGKLFIISKISLFSCSANSFFIVNILLAIKDLAKFLFICLNEGICILILFFGISAKKLCLGAFAFSLKFEFIL